MSMFVLFPFANCTLDDSCGFVPFFERGYVASLILKPRNTIVIIHGIYPTEKEDKGEMVNVFFPKVT